MLHHCKVDIPKHQFKKVLFATKSTHTHKKNNKQQIFFKSHANSRYTHRILTHTFSLISNFFFMTFNSSYRNIKNKPQIPNHNLQHHFYLSHISSKLKTLRPNSNKSKHRIHRGLHIIPTLTNHKTDKCLLHTLHSYFACFPKQNSKKKVKRHEESIHKHCYFQCIFHFCFCFFQTNIIRKYNSLRLYLFFFLISYLSTPKHHTYGLYSTLNTRKNRHPIYKSTIQFYLKS